MTELTIIFFVSLMFYLCTKFNRDWRWCMFIVFLMIFIIILYFILISKKDLTKHLKLEEFVTTSYLDIYEPSKNGKPYILYYKNSIPIIKIDEMIINIPFFNIYVFKDYIITEYNNISFMFCTQSIKIIDILRLIFKIINIKIKKKNILEMYKLINIPTIIFNDSEIINISDCKDIDKIKIHGVNIRYTTIIKFKELLKEVDVWYEIMHILKSKKLVTE